MRELKDSLSQGPLNSSVSKSVVAFLGDPKGDPNSETCPTQVLVKPT